MDVVVHERVHRRHPEIDTADVLHAWKHAIALRRRNCELPGIFTVVGIDERGRLLEMIGVEIQDGRILVYHALKLTAKFRKEMGL